MAESAYFGGIELGGTKIVLAVGRGDGEIFARSTLPTREPRSVMPEICAFFGDCGMELAGLGVGAFGTGLFVVQVAAARRGARGAQTGLETYLQQQ